MHIYHKKRLSNTHTLLVTTYLLVTIPALIMNFILNINIANSYKADFMKSSELSLAKIEQYVDKQLGNLLFSFQSLHINNECQTILKKKTQRPDLEKYYDNRAFQRALNQVITYQSNIKGIYVYDTDGTYHASNSNTGFLNLSERLPDGIWLNEIKPDDKLVHYLPLHKPKQLTDGSLVFSLVRNIIDLDTGRELGLLLLDVDSQLLVPESFDNNKDADLYFITDKERKLYYVPKDVREAPSHKNQKVSSTFEEEREVLTLKDTVFDKIFSVPSTLQGSYHATWKGESVLITYTTSKYNELKIITVVPTTIKSNTFYILLRSTLIWIIPCILFAIIIMAYAVRSISRPIDHLATIMSQVDMDNLDILVEPQGTREVYLLGERFNKMISQIKYLLEKEYRLKLIQKETEYTVLQQQINPHFLYNTLESLAAYADINDVPKISQICLMMSNMFRYNADTSHTLVPLRHELAHIKCYGEIMNLRFNDMIHITCEISEELNQVLIPKFVLQPLVENAIVHGYEEFLVPGTITISAQILEKEFIQIRINDNGKGISQEKVDTLLSRLHSEELYKEQLQKKSCEHIGLFNVHYRLKTLFGDEFGVTAITSRIDEGTCIVLTLPVRKNCDFLK